MGRFGMQRPIGRAVVLFSGIAVLASGMAAWRYAAAQESEGPAAAEMMEVVTAAEAEAHEYRGSATAIGTVLATRSVTLRNEVPGTVRRVDLVPGRVVEAGAVLVALDVSVEQAELKALRARAELAATTLVRLERMAEQRAISAIELDNARAEVEVAEAEVARLEAVIARKTIRAPFRARIGISDVHPGQFIESGTELTTLQGVESAVNVDFSVAQAVAGGIRPGDALEVHTGDDEDGPIIARVVAVDARVDPATRNATVRARIDETSERLAPGASVRVRVPVGASQSAVIVPVSALRKGPGGDYVFVLTEEGGALRSHMRPVRPGPVVGDEVVILEGLEVRERVAATGSFKLREGALVHLAEGAASTAAVR